MKYFTWDFGRVYQFIIDDPDAQIYIHLLDMFRNIFDLKLIRRVETPETPMFDFEYQGVPFAFFYEEYGDETVFAVKDKNNIDVIRKFIDSL